MAKAVKPRKKGYKMPDPLPQGLILEDIAKKKWRLGPSIGKGGFGEIYSAQEHGGASPKRSYPYVIKIEPHENGPLFVEMHFYMRNAKPAEVEAFMKQKKLDTFGMPKYFGSGSHMHQEVKYRFVVMEKFGSDIWKLFLQNKRQFPVETVFKLAIQMLDVLEYIHSKGYIHADIKGPNILLGQGKEAQHQVYLVDFGLSTRYNSTYKPDPKKAHNGTIEYVSRDAHLGVESRRGDLEILGYNLVQWLGCVLPWEKNLADPVFVQNNKQKHMEDLPGFFKTCFVNKEPPSALVDYFKYFTSLKYETDPDYKKLRKILVSGLEKAGGSVNSPLKFKAQATPLKRKADKKNKVEEEDSEEVHVNGDVPEKRSRKAKADNRGEKVEPPKKTTSSKKTPKKGKKKDAQEESDSVEARNGQKNGKSKAPIDEESDEESRPLTNGYTAEMQRIQDKIDAKKAKAKKTEAAGSARVMRNRKNVNYNEKE